MSAPEGNSKLVPSLDPSLFFGPGNAFQNRSVSSPAPVTIVWPSGDIAKYRTLRSRGEGGKGGGGGQMGGRKKTVAVGMQGKKRRL
jgi:hypothetical protein